MNDLYAKLTEWFSSPLDAHLSDQLASIIRSCKASLTPVWHPLGFIHVELAQSEIKDCFRMHVWSSDHRDAREQGDKIHDHLFHVKSRVVFGSIKNIRYQFIPNAQGNHREVRVNYAPHGSSLLDSNLYGDLEEIGCDVLRAPTEYIVAKFELHETLLDTSDLALTIVHTTESEDYQPRAIFRRDAPLPPVRAPIPCDKALWHSLLQKMLLGISASGFSSRT
jgi:hypothetical protein